MLFRSKTVNGQKASEISVEDLSVQLEILKDDIASLTSTMSEFGQAKAAQVRDTAQTKASELSRTAQARADELTTAGLNKARETQEQAEDFVRTQPGAAVGIAAGVGFLVGLITARR